MKNTSTLIIPQGNIADVVQFGIFGKRDWLMRGKKWNPFS